ncbi:hypothetical protein U8527_17645 [Kordia algicida OT-1]|uniref:Uncharacterized protein n=1 Tax=Kordia algicida OT-1 TaxID=391587 RepID=A9E3I7_9FLAO|nr:hypothetical protein [Kordia algicida]EDP95516.1 hypothetical protein KAOT1_11351 [Kordia algicida OT-1]
MKKRSKKLQLERQIISKITLSEVVGGQVNFTGNYTCNCETAPVNCNGTANSER